MFNKTVLRSLGGALVLGLTASAAQAHPGHGVEGLLGGLAHPLLGFDHLLAMVAVGMWSAVALPAGRRAMGPMAFVAMLPVGALLARSGLTVPGVEPAVAMSVALLAVLMLGAKRVAVPAGLSVVALAALMHGFAHGADVSGAALSGSSFAVYAVGFMTGSALLHAFGLGLGTLMQSTKAWVWRAAAGLIGTGGLLMLAARV